MSSLNISQIGNMKKIKSFSLIEVTIASFIFMIVAIMATASFAMVRRTNERVKIYKDTGECREILQNYVENGVKNSNKGSRILGIDSSLKFKDIQVLNDSTELNALLPEQYKFIGLAMIEENGYSVIYKQDQRYLYNNFEDSIPSNGESSQAGGEFLKTGDLSCFGSSEPESSTPFKIWGLKNIKSPSSHLITVVLEDGIYDVKGPNPENKNFSYLFSTTINNKGSFE